MKNKYKKVYSQNGEDGVIEYIFNNIGLSNRIFVEFGFAWGENNSRNLIEKYNFNGLFIDNGCKTTSKNKIYFHKAWITKDNINTIIGNYYRGNIDFLSIDVDGIDLYLFDIISIVSPRVVCIEYCASIGKDLSVTVKYKDNFDRHKEHPSGFYCNASLKANINIAKKKGYKFVGTVAGLNAFFVRDDCNLGNLRELTCEEGWESHHARTYQKHKRHDGSIRKMTQEEQFDTIKNLQWVEVSEDGIIKWI